MTYIFNSWLTQKNILRHFSPTTLLDIFPLRSDNCLPNRFYSASKFIWNLGLSFCFHHDIKFEEIFSWEADKVSEGYKNLTKYLPGQRTLLQGVDSVLTPTQSLPPFIGAGLLHWRVRFFIPFEPQEWEQEV